MLFDFDEGAMPLADAADAPQVRLPVHVLPHTKGYNQSASCGRESQGHRPGREAARLF